MFIFSLIVILLNNEDIVDTTELSASIELVSEATYVRIEATEGCENISDNAVVSDYKPVSIFLIAVTLSVTCIELFNAYNLIFIYIDSTISSDTALDIYVLNVLAVKVVEVMVTLL